MKKVSVIMPAYNAGRFIDEAIKSVIEQSYSEWDLTIVNDGSSDNTKEIISRYVMQYPQKIKLIDKVKNEGTVSGLNTLIDAVDGDYICWLSADDVYTLDMLEESVSFLDKYKEYDLVFAGYETIDENSNFLGKAPYNKGVEDLKTGNLHQPYNYLLRTGCCIHGCTVMLRNYCFKEVGKFNKCYRYAHDYDVWLRMAAKYKIGYIDNIHVKGREYSSQISKQGHNEIDAIHVLFDFIESNNFEALYHKAGYTKKSEAISEIIIGQLKAYKHREKEFTELLKILLDTKSQIIDEFWKDDNNQELYNIVNWLKQGDWYCEESFFEDNTEDSYLNLLCDIANVDAFLINYQAIRFERFEGNSIERFHKGLMRSNDIVVGIVQTDKLKDFLSKNKSDYRFYKLFNAEGKIKIGFTYYMYKILQIHKTLDMEDIQFTHCDIWWELLKEIYTKKLIKGDV